MHQSSFHIMTRFKDLVEKTFPQEKVTILDVGSYGVNGTYKEIFSNPAKFIYTGLDVNPGPNVDYVPVDPYKWADLPDESFDVIISGQAFEHIEFPWLIIDEISRVLKINGLACIVAPSRGPEHKYPVDCWRYYPDGFRALAKWANLQVLDAKATWGKSGFTDGSDQWGDAFCIMFKQQKTDKREKHKKTTPKTLLRKNQNNPLNKTKQDSYYGFARPEVIEAIVKNNIPTGKVLELGCAGGATGKKLKERLPVQSYVGIELSPEAADIAKQYLDKIIVANIEETDLASEYDLKPGDFDLLLALDVLEHLYNPWDVLAELACYLKPGGYVVASIPNIQNIGIVRDLVKGKWPYQDAGILDTTHLRFFTLEEAQKMFTGAGLAIKSIDRVILSSENMPTMKESGNIYREGNLVIDNLTKKDLLDLYTYQYILIARKPSSLKVEYQETPISTFDHQRSELQPQFEHKNALSQMTSIVILTFNQLEYTKKCVKSISKHTPENHEIIFIDNGSTDKTVQWLKTQVKEKKNYKLIENKQNLGFAKGCNQGIEASQGEYILLLNNDTVVAKGWLSGLIDCLTFAPHAGIIGPMTNNISGPQQIVSREYGSLDNLDEYAAKFKKQYAHRRIPLRRIVGFCMLFKRTLAEQIGMLDESFGTGNFEDDDLCVRAALAGYRNYVAGDIFIHHFGSRSFIGNKINYSASISDNRKIIDKKWTLSIASQEGKKLAALKAVELADTLYQKGNLNKAVETLVNGLKYSPEELPIYYEMIRFFIESKKFAEANEVIASIPESARKDLKGMEYAGYIQEGLGLDDEAAVLVEKMLSLHSQYPPAINLLGVLSYKKGDKEKAKEFFQQAIEADPGYGEAYTNLGVLYWGIEQREEAFGNLKKGFLLSPALPDASSLYYSVVSSLDRFSQAEDDFAEACRLHPQNKNLVFLYIDILIQQEKFDSAILRIQDALTTFGLDEGTLNAALAVRDRIGPLQIEKSGKKGTLSLCMIVKNEEKHLAKCLKSVRDVVDEMIIVDTGSTDKTKDIAKVFGAKLYDFPWTGDFSAARNESLAHATGDWVLILDADEVISSMDYPEIRELMRKDKPRPAAYSIVTRNYLDDSSILGWTPNKGEYPEESGRGWLPSPKVRLLSRRPDIYFTYPVHETLENSLVKAGVPIMPSKIVVHHYGKLAVADDLHKGELYYLLGLTKLESDPNNFNHILELARQALTLKRYEESIDLSLRLRDLAKTDAHARAFIRTNRPFNIDLEAEIYLLLSSAYLPLNRFAEALEVAKQAALISPDRKEIIQCYANCEVVSGSLDKAYQTLYELLMEAPDYPAAQLLLAIIFCLKGEHEKMENLFRILLSRGFSITDAMNLMAERYIIQNRNEEARLILHTIKKHKLGNIKTDELLDTTET